MFKLIQALQSQPSQHSTSNQPTSFHSIPVMLPASDTVHLSPIHDSHVTEDLRERDEVAADSDSEEEGRDENMEIAGGATAGTRGLSDQLMQLDNVSEDIRLGSPDDGANNMDPNNIDLLTVTGMTDSAEHHRRNEMGRVKLIRGLQQSQYGFPSIDVLTKEHLCADGIDILGVSLKLLDMKQLEGVKG